jgi:hypothetical protein
MGAERTAQKTQFFSVIENIHLKLYSEIIALCSQIHTKHVNRLCGRNVPRTKHVKWMTHKLTTP